MQSKNVGLAYKLIWPFRYLKAPTKFDYVDEHSISRKMTFFSNFTDVEDRISIVFLGDFMGVGSKKVYLDDELKNFINSGDKIIFNLEAVIVDSSELILSKQYVHSKVFSSFLSQLQSDKVIVGVANNHLLDYGVNGLVDSLSLIQECGASYIGTSNRGKIQLSDGLFINASTFWTQKDDRYLNRFKRSRSNEQVIQFFHWGNEFDCFANIEQTNLVKELENSIAVIGHHSHCPQPIQMVEEKLTAYSLGNLATCYNLEKINNGLVLKLNLVKTKGVWKLSTSEWEHLKIEVDKNYTVIKKGQI